ncbi:MAG TPA: hypothetical protein VFV83_00225 [Chthoniobacteraceae bacterium]|nr:hypothetical protein [Chthoniobacteraceae bacterium]
MIASASGLGFALIPAAAQRPERSEPAIVWQQLPSLPEAEGFAGSFAGVIDRMLIPSGEVRPRVRTNEVWAARFTDAR